MDPLSNTRYAERHYIWGKCPPSPPNDVEMLKVWDSSGTIPIDGVVHPSHPSHQPTCIAFLHRQELIQLQEASQEGHWATDILELKELVTTNYHPHSFR